MFVFTIQPYRLRAVTEFRSRAAVELSDMYNKVTVVHSSGVTSGANRDLLVLGIPILSDPSYGFGWNKADISESHWNMGSSMST